MTGEHADLRRPVARANNEMAEAGLVVHAFGNASQVDREAGVFAISRAASPARR
jgi:ribulose-5-phosphate 4-epimerase/fuculose-1-phosphate aldolase